VPAEDEVTGTPSDAATLSDHERRVLDVLRTAPDVLQEEEVVGERAGVSLDVVRGSLERLRSKRLALVEQEARAERRLTRRGEEARRTGLPERRFLQAIDAHGGQLAPGDVRGLGFSEEEQAAAIGYLRRHKFLAEGVPFRRAPNAPDSASPFPEEKVLEGVARSEPVEPTTFAALLRRGLVAEERRATRRWMPSPEGRSLVLPAPGTPTVGPLSPSLLASGEWDRVAFRPYDVRATVPYLQGARPHPYLAWLEQVEEVLIGLGFTEIGGPLVETEFRNADVLFMPQEHPARSVHDLFFAELSPGAPLPAELLERVAAVHEGRPMPGETEPVSPGWRSPYSRERVRTPVLRSQTTSVSARYLAQRPEPPFRAYCIDRNFRPDALDARHHIEFDQCEGVLGAEGTNLRHLIGVFRAFADGLGIHELRIRPSYFPFTEPSVEGYVHHPQLGWMEIFPGGMLRPEVLRPAGVNVPVAAWGIGITRLALLGMGVNDIRELYLDDLARLRGRPD
jgi:phenylalanyl-tRNA synthetase alpha chain